MSVSKSNDKKTLSSREVKGLLRIVIKAASNVFTKGPDGHLIFKRKDFSRLRIKTDDGEIVPIQFNCHVGYELNGERVTYCSSQEVKTCAVEGLVPDAPVFDTYKITTQKLIPVHDYLPQYVTYDYIPVSDK